MTLVEALQPESPYVFYSDDHGFCINTADVMDILMNKKLEYHWIPCSERLPEVGTYVLISKKALNFRSNLPNVCTAHRSCDPRSGKEEWNDMLFGKLDDDDVLAWMPLPEPYREEGENGENDV